MVTPKLQNMRDMIATKFEGNEERTLSGKSGESACFVMHRDQ